MHPFSQMARGILVRDVCIVSFAGAMLLICLIFKPLLAFKGTATLALLFSAALIVRASRLTEDGLDELEAWRGLDPEQRPIGDEGRRWARDYFEELLLRVAKVAAMFAIWFYCAGLVAEAAA